MSKYNVDLKFKSLINTDNIVFACKNDMGRRISIKDKYQARPP